MATLTEQIAADEAAVAAAQSALDAASEQLAANKAALAAAQPHLSVWQEVEAYASTVGGEVESALKDFAARGKSLLNL